jgi:D-glycero-D-manno-heptose 1,7-bisphosphate phosphatase
LSRAEVRPALFLDRDGVLNELVWYGDTREWESPRVPEDLRLLPGAAEAAAALVAAGWPLFLVSNQPSFAKGKTTLEALKAVHVRLQEELARAGGFLEEAYYCYHHPQGKVPGYAGPCPCRKPSPHFLLEAARAHRLDLGRSWMVGD